MLLKTQSALQFARSSAQNDIKRKEKEVEKVMDRWAKITAEQARLGSVGAGMACANLVIVNEERPPLVRKIVANHDLLLTNDAMPIRTIR